MEEEITIDLRELAHIVQKNARFIAKVTGGCIVAAGLYLLIASPVYESDSLLRIKQPKGIGSSLLESMPMGNAMASKQLMSTYAEILKSRSVIVPVIEQTEEADSDGKYMRYEDYIKNRIVTNPFKDTEILKVTVNANTPEGAQKANDLIVNGFLQRLTGLVREEQKTTRAFIEERVVASKAELEAAESALTEYKKASKILSPTDEMKLAADKMGIVDKLRAENKVALATAQAQLSATDQQLGGEAKATADNAVIKQYNAKLAELETQRIDYLDKYTAKHPKVIETEDAIANLKSKLQQEIAKVASLQAPSDNPVHQQLLTSKFGSEAAISVAESNLAELERLDKRNQEDVERLSEKEQKYLSLMRDVSVADEIYIMLAKRLEEAKVAEVAVSTEVQVVDTATLPEDPVKPKKFLTLLLAAFLGIFGGSGFVIAKELMNRTIKTTDDVANYLDLPVLGSVPDYESLNKNMKKEQQEQSLTARLRRYLWKTITLIADRDAKSPVAEAYRTIRTNIQFSNVGQELKTIIVTSATPNEGKSTTISNLAVVMAQAGYKVLLMDCDMRNPTQHKIFKLTNKGLSNCISASEEVREVIQKTGIENLELLASGPVAPNPSELLGSKRMEQLLERLKPDYDYILIDTPPIMPVTDAAVLSGKVDGLVMLVSSGEVTPAAAKEAKQRLLQAGAHILGVILNKVELVHTHGYGYYYYYGSDSTSGVGRSSPEVRWKLRRY